MYVVGPLLAFAVIAGLAAVLRWTFHSDLDIPAAFRLDPNADPEDFGLLRPVATVDERSTAKSIARQLEEAGIRATVADTPDGRVHVLVFGSALDRARRVVG
jgi:hypothetical protein